AQPKVSAEPPAAESLARGGETRRATLPLHQFRPVISIALPGRPRMISWSRDGNLLISTFFSHPPLLMNRNGDTKMLPSGIARAACWNPAGRLLAVSIPTPQRGQASSQAQIWDGYTPTQPLITLPLHAREIDGLDWSITGELAAWEEQQIKLFHITQRYPQQAQEGITRPISTPADMTCGNTDSLRWSPDGKWLAAGAKNGAIICWHGPTRTVHHQVQSQGGFVYGLAWSPDSALLAAAFNDHHIEIWNVAEKRRVTQWRDLPHIPRALSFSIHNTLAIASNTQELVLGNVRDAGPSTSHAGHWVAAWSPTRAELATLDAQTGSVLVVWEALTPQS
ncbi:MAG TPA: hypothetical protein VGT44_22325, partial [Ktedonobacteraceae bacterium]|nr:hypothetical protein [Ktedonobacteraceae bacterium]